MPKDTSKKEEKSEEKEEEKKEPEKEEEKKEPEKKKPEKKEPEKKEEKKQDSQKKDERKRENHDVPYAFRLLSSLIGAISGLITWILQKVAAGLNLAAEAIMNARKKKRPVEPEKEKSDEKDKEKTAEKKAEKTAETKIEMQDLSAKKKDSEKTAEPEKEVEHTEEKTSEERPGGAGEGSDGQPDSPDKKKKESDVPRWMNEMTNNRDQFVAAMLLSHGPERQKLMDAMSGRSELSDEELNQTLDHAYIGYEGAKKDGKLDTSKLADGMDWLKDEMRQQHTIEKDTFAMADAARRGMDMISRDENQKGPDSWANTHKDTRRELRGFVAMTDIKQKAMDREKWLRDPANADKQMDQKEIRECARDLMLGKTVDALYHCCRRKEGEKVRSDMALRLSIPKGKAPEPTAGSATLISCNALSISSNLFTTIFPPLSTLNNSGEINISPFPCRFSFMVSSSFIKSP